MGEPEQSQFRQKPGPAARETGSAGLKHASVNALFPTDYFNAARSRSELLFLSSNSGTRANALATLNASARANLFHDAPAQRICVLDIQVCHDMAIRVPRLHEFFAHLNHDPMLLLGGPSAVVS